MLIVVALHREGKTRALAMAVATVARLYHKPALD